MIDEKDNKINEDSIKSLKNRNKDDIMQGFKELFKQNRIEIEFNDFSNCSVDGVKMSIILDNEKVYETIVNGNINIK